MPTMTPHGEKFTTKTELGHVVGEAFILFWRDFRDGFKEGIRKHVPDTFPLNAVEGIMLGVVDVIYNLTWRVVVRLGILIGDQSHKLIFGKAEEAINKMKATLDAVINDAKTKLQSQLTKLQGIADGFRDQLADLETAKNKLTSGFNDLDARFRGLRDQATRDIADLDSRVKDVKAKTDQAINEFQAKMDKLNLGLDDAEKRDFEHTGDIQELFDRVKNLEGTSKDQKDGLAWLKEKLGGM